MKIALLLLAILALAGCGNVATVKEVKVRDPGAPAKSTGPLAELDRELAAAEAAWGRLDANPADTAARSDYNFAVSRVIGTLRESKLTPWRAPIKTGTRTLEWPRPRLAAWNPALYDLIPTDQLEVRGKYVEDREIKDGLGATLVAKGVGKQANDFAPTPNSFYSVTAVARFEGSRCILSLEDPLGQETVTVGRRTFPLAADYTAPLAMMLVEMEPEQLGLPRLLHPSKFAATTRIARMEQFDPDKTVILFVHGLMSSPATWFPLMNRLRADEEIRRNYQFWFYSYPSGYPYPYPAEILRQELDEAEKRFPSDKKMVVIGHSMGGCISRLLITDSGMKIWDQMFTVPPEKMNLTPEHRHIITESTIFEHRPEIGRVIFISTPHRGSDFATNWIGRLGTRLVKLPGTLVSLGTEEAEYQKHTDGDLHLDRFPDSVDTLAPNNDFVLALNKVPISPGIPYHTVYGDRGKGDSPNSTDGFVPYWSSHFPGAASVKVVPSHHGAHQNPEGMAEVERILRLNLTSPR